MSTSEAERLVKLALFIKEHEPVDFTTIRTGLHEYALAQSDDEAERRRSETRTRRMFERDKATLETCGIFIKADARSCYSLDRDTSYAAPVDLTDPQASLLRLVCTSLIKDESYPFKDELRMVLVKIGDELGVPDLLFGMGSSGTDTASNGLPASFKKVRRSIDTRKRLSFEYHSANGTTSQRSVEPFGCFFLQGRCCVVAFDPDAASERTFRLDRMRHLKVNGVRANTPDFPARAFTARDWHRLPFQFGPNATPVTITFDANSAWRAERLSMGFGTFDKYEDGSVQWHVETRDLDALASWCIENGPGITPVAPQSARARYCSILTGALEVCV